MNWTTNLFIVPLTYQYSLLEIVFQVTVEEEMKISEKKIEKIVEECVSYCAANGICMGSKVSDKLFTHAPITLFPQSYPKKEFLKAKALAVEFNTMVHNIAVSSLKNRKSKADWINSTLRNTVEFDDFTRKLLEIYNKEEEIYRTHGYSFQTNFLGIHRSDYMLDHTDLLDRLLQIELNTIASSFGGLSQKVAQMHKYLLHRFPFPEAELIRKSFQENSPVKKITDGMALAVNKYNEGVQTEKPVAVVFVVQQGEKNSFDQKLLEYDLFERHGIRSLRLSLNEIAEKTKFAYEAISGIENNIVIDGQVVGLFYFRAGYTPSDYPSPTEWKAREFIETSFALKCPNITYHLLGTKKVQQKLSIESELKQFVAAEVAPKLRDVFAGQWSMHPAEQNSDDLNAIKKARTSEDFVLKPQREGGGNNFYGNDVGKFLASGGEAFGESPESYVLMQRIYPQKKEATLVRDGEMRKGECLSELGVFGVMIANVNDGEVAMNEEGGYLIRVKFDGVNEGGVATGYSCLGSIYTV
eukprot:snap_masked-scaffold_6-processed-gene-13.25-mRNA-1 protein AED:0.23 eAED:0.25 QI:0/-1/0/1/-1/1/1/0/525